jgi:hypothetical protein
MRNKDTLLHRKALLVITTGNSENVALEFIADGISGNLLREFLVVEDATRVNVRWCTNERTVKIPTISSHRLYRLSFAAPSRGLLWIMLRRRPNVAVSYEDILAMLSFMLGQRQFDQIRGGQQSILASKGFGSVSGNDVDVEMGRRN